jgi:hypothetical protein
MISTFWVSFGLLMGVLVVHTVVPPVSTLLRLPPLPSNWIVGGVGMVLGAGRFWCLLVTVSQLAHAGRAGIFPDGWFGAAVFVLLGLITLAVYMAWISAITGERRDGRAAGILAPAYLTIIVAETVYVFTLLPD